MKEFLKRIKLLDHATTEIEINKSDFVAKLKQHVDEGSTYLFSDIFDVFSSSKNEYKGHVDFDGFKIKRRKRFFDMNMNLAIASGKYRQHEDKLIIDTEINGFSGMMIPFFVFIILFYPIFFYVFFMTGNAPLIIFPFILIHGCLMLGIPYFIMRRSVKRMKRELEREFYYMTKK